MKKSMVYLLLSFQFFFAYQASGQPISKEREVFVGYTTKVLKVLPDNKSAKEKLNASQYKQFAKFKKDLIKLSASNNKSEKSFQSLYTKTETNFERRLVVFSIVPTEDLQSSCPGGCHSERLECKAKCEGAGKKFCGCGTVAFFCGLRCFWPQLAVPEPPGYRAN